MWLRIIVRNSWQVTPEGKACKEALFGVDAMLVLSGVCSCNPACDLSGGMRDLPLGVTHDHDPCVPVHDCKSLIGARANL